MYDACAWLRLLLVGARWSSLLAARCTSTLFHSGPDEAPLSGQWEVGGASIAPHAAIWFMRLISSRYLG